MFVDGHCHLDLPAFDADRDAVIERARAVGVTEFVLAGVDPVGWANQRRLAATVPGVHRAAGLHPWRAAELDRVQRQAAIDGLTAELAAGAVAVGELGLDRHFRSRETLPAQEAAFRAQLAIAREIDRPVVLHVVAAHGRALEILTADGLPRAGGVVHGFSGSPEVAARYLRLGLHLGVGGAISRSARLRRAVGDIPPDRVLLETDAPDQAPAGVDGRCEPAHLLRVAAEVAALTDDDVPALLQRSSDNARRLYHL